MTVNLNGLSKLSNTLLEPAVSAGPHAPADARKVAKDFESVFLHKLMEEMSRTVSQDGLFGGADTEQIQGLFWLELSKEMANKGGLGLWRQLERQIQNMQGSSKVGMEQK